MSFNERQFKQNSPNQDYHDNIKIIKRQLMVEMNLKSESIGSTSNNNSIAIENEQ